MAVLHVFEAKGNPADLLKKYDASAAAFADPKHQGGAIAHICVETSDGIAIFNLMDSAGHVQALVADKNLHNTLAANNFTSKDLAGESQKDLKVHKFVILRGP